MSSIITQKGLYAVRAVLELARHGGSDRPLRMADIAKAQDIPPRFLEAILNQLRRAGIAESVRGPVGGYLLARPAQSVSVGEVLRAIQGPMQPVAQAPQVKRRTSFDVLTSLWGRAEGALNQVFDHTSFAQLLDEEAVNRGTLAFDI